MQDDDVGGRGLLTTAVDYRMTTIKVDQNVSTNTGVEQIDWPSGRLQI